MKNSNSKKDDEWLKSIDNIFTKYSCKKSKYTTKHELEIAYRKICHSLKLNKAISELLTDYKSDHDILQNVSKSINKSFKKLEGLSPAKKNKPEIKDLFETIDKLQDRLCLATKTLGKTHKGRKADPLNTIKVLTQLAWVYVYLSNKTPECKPTYTDKFVGEFYDFIIDSIKVLQQFGIGFVDIKTLGRRAYEITYNHGSYYANFYKFKEFSDLESMKQCVIYFEIESQAQNLIKYHLIDPDDYFQSDELSLTEIMQKNNPKLNKPLTISILNRCKPSILNCLSKRGQTPRPTLIKDIKNFLENTASDTC